MTYYVNRKECMQSYAAKSTGFPEKAMESAGKFDPRSSSNFIKIDY